MIRPANIIGQIVINIQGFICLGFPSSGFKTLCAIRKALYNKLIITVPPPPPPPPSLRI